MRVIKGVADNGLYSKMMNEGYNDIVLMIENEEIPSISSILCVSNERLKSLIKDEKAEEKVLLPDQVTKKAFSLLCDYYGYGIVELEESNVVELLLCCVCLNEEDLLNECIIFIECHLNNGLVIEILNKIDYIPNNLVDFRNRVNDYIRLNCACLFDDTRIFKRLTLDNLKYIITLEDLLIPSEKYLLEKILNHYHKNNEKMENKEEEYNDVMKYLNWKVIRNDELEEKDLDIIDMNIMKKAIFKSSIKRKYGKIPKTNNALLNEMILNGFKDIDVIKRMLYEDYECLLSTENIKEEISNYLKEIKYVLEILTILRIMKRMDIKKNDLTLNDEELNDIIELLTEKYKENREEEKKMTIECLSYFIDGNIFSKKYNDIKPLIESIPKSIRYLILTEMLNDKQIEDKTNIIKYVANDDDEKEKQLIISNVDDEEIKEMIISKSYIISVDITIDVLRYICDLVIIENVLKKSEMIRIKNENLVNEFKKKAYERFGVTEEEMERAISEYADVKVVKHYLILINHISDKPPECEIPEVLTKEVVLDINKEWFSNMIKVMEGQLNEMAKQRNISIEEFKNIINEDKNLSNSIATKIVEKGLDCHYNTLKKHNITLLEFINANKKYEYDLIFDIKIQEMKKRFLSEMNMLRKMML